MLTYALIALQLSTSFQLAAAPKGLGIDGDDVETTQSSRTGHASFDKASVHNERMSLRLRPLGDDGTRDLAVVQIAGLVARRIVCDLTQGQGVQQGARFGIIRFGSRVDVYLPPGCIVMAEAGTKVRAGETVLARFQG